MKKIFILIAVVISTTAFAQNKSQVIFNPQMRMLLAAPDYKFVTYQVVVISATDKTVKGPFVVKDGIQTMEAAKALGKARPGDKVVYEKIKVKEVKTGKVIDVANYSTVIVPRPAKPSPVSPLPSPVKH